MNRRHFIKNASMAAALVAVSPISPTLMEKSRKKQQVVFIFRGVSYTDGFNAFKNFQLTPNQGFHIQKVTCNSPEYKHQDGIQAIVSGQKRGKSQLSRSEFMINEGYAEIFKEIFGTHSKETRIVHLHHTEIGHSSHKIYGERLNAFFSLLPQYYNQELFNVIVTADIGRNTDVNSCGGRDHSNPTCLNTFAIYLGENASRLSKMSETISQHEILSYQF